MTNTHPAGVNCFDGIGCGERLGGHCDGVLGQLLPHLRYGRAHGCARPACGRYLLISRLSASCPSSCRPFSPCPWTWSLHPSSSSPSTYCPWTSCPFSCHRRKLPTSTG